MDDIGARLRATADGDVREMARAALIGGVGPADHAELSRYADEMEAAADAITALRAEVERWRTIAVEDGQVARRYQERAAAAARAALREQTGELRMCLTCGKLRPASEGRGDLPECEHPDYPGVTACTWQYTPQEAWEYWRKEAHELRAVVTAAYRAGWDASGEGWNGEYPGDAHERQKWQQKRDADLAAIRAGEGKL